MFKRTHLIKFSFADQCPGGFAFFWPGFWRLPEEHRSGDECHGHHNERLLLGDELRRLVLRLVVPALRYATDWRPRGCAVLLGNWPPGVCHLDNGLAGGLQPHPGTGLRPNGAHLLHDIQSLFRQEPCHVDELRPDADRPGVDAVPHCDAETDADVRLPGMPPGTHRN